MSGPTKPNPGRLIAFARQPLLLAQASASLSGAVAMIAAAAAMDTASFVAFSLINLISMTALGLTRAGLFQPALIQLRRDPAAHVTWPTATVAALLASLAATAATHAIHQLTMAEAGWLLLGGLFPILHDWLRFRAMSLDRRWWVLAGDGLRLLLVCALSPLVLSLTRDPVGFQLAQTAAFAGPVLLLGWQLPSARSATPVWRYRRAALLQLADFSIGQFNTTVPLILLGGLGGSATIAGVRFGQTLLGPLNLVFSASSANLITDAANDHQLAHDRELVRRGSAVAARLGLGSAAVVLLLVGLAAAVRPELSGVPSSALGMGLLLVGAAAVSSGWAGLHAILLRLLGCQGVATAGRLALVSATAAGYLFGYLAGGVDLSVTAGFLVAAVASPLALFLPARAVYRRLDLNPAAGRRGKHASSNARGTHENQLRPGEVHRGRL